MVDFPSARSDLTGAFAGLPIVGWCGLAGSRSISGMAFQITIHITARHLDLGVVMANRAAILGPAGAASRSRRRIDVTWKTAGAFFRGIDAARGEPRDQLGQLGGLPAIGR